MPRLLTRYLFQRFVFLLFTALLASVGIYLLIDVFDRLDNFLHKGAPASLVVLYFVYKLPIIVSQILPAVFLLTLVILLTILVREREIIALEAGGISFSRLGFYFVFLGLLSCAGQLFFSQWFGVAGEQRSAAIWDSLGSKPKKYLEQVWFCRQDKIVFLDKLFLEDKTAQGVTVFFLAQGFEGLKRIVQAKQARFTGKTWLLSEVQIILPDRFILQNKDRLVLDLDQDILSIVALKTKHSPERMSIWQVGRLLNELGNSGVNLVPLKTAWHMKLAYAFSCVVLSLLALLIARQSENMFLNLVLGMVATFVFYVFFVLGSSLAQKGVLPPWLGAWLSNIIFGLAGLAGQSKLLWQEHGWRRA